MNTLTMEEVKTLIQMLLRKYNAEYALLFGSYARGEATAESDIDVVAEKTSRQETSFLLVRISAR